MMSLTATLRSTLSSSLRKSPTKTFSPLDLKLSLRDLFLSFSILNDVNVLNSFHK